MALSAIAKTKRDGAITLADGTGSPVTLTVQYEDGDLSIEGISKHQSELVAFFEVSPQTRHRKRTRTGLEETPMNTTQKWPQAVYSGTGETM